MQERIAGLIFNSQEDRILSREGDEDRILSKEGGEDRMLSSNSPHLQIDDVCAISVDW